MNCVLLGTSALAIPTAEALLKLFSPLPSEGLSPSSRGGAGGGAWGARGGGFVGVITKPTEPAGRKHDPTPPPIAAWAKERGVRCWQPETKEALTTLLRELAPDVAVVVAYGKIITSEALTIPEFGFVNLHPSLLPKYRGPSPIQSAIANGDTETGVTLMLLDAEVDHGPILAQERVPLSPTATRSSLERELAERGAALLERVLPEYLTGRITPQPQDHVRATTTPLLSREDGRIFWDEPAAVIERKIRAYEGWPGTWCALTDGRRLKVLKSAVNGPTALSPGTIDRSRDRFDAACGDNVLLTLEIVQPEGGVRMQGVSFLNGAAELRLLR